MMSLKRVVPVLLALSLAQLSCLRLSSSIREEERERIRATYDALLTPQIPASTSTPACLLPNLFDCPKTATPALPTETPTPGATPTSPAVLRVSAVRENVEWAPYFSGPEKIAAYEPGDSFPANVGVLGGGFSLPVLEEIQGGRYLKVLVTGWVETHDLGLENYDPENVLHLTGKIECVDHNWGHSATRCHAHFWEGSRVMGSILKGLVYIVVSPALVDGKAQITIVSPVWVRSQDVQ